MSFNRKVFLLSEFLVEESIFKIDFKFSNFIINSNILVPKFNFEIRFSRELMIKPSKKISNKFTYISS